LGKIVKQIYTLYYGCLDLQITGKAAIASKPSKALEDFQVGKVRPASSDVYDALFCFKI
jgi:hypothetical protein